MLRKDSGEMHPSAASLCCVVPVGSDDEGEALVEHYEALVQALSSQDWRVHILLCSLDTGGEIGRATSAFRKAGAEVTSLAGLHFPREVTLKGPNQFPALLLGDRVFHALGSLHATHTFQLIEFADRGGLGLRTIQAKRAGLGFADVGMIVKLHGPTIWLDRQRQRWIEKWEDLGETFGERFAFENADHKASISNSLLDDMRAMDWNVNEVASVGDLDKSDLDCLYRSWLNTPDRYAETPSEHMPLVTVGVAHYNLGAFLPDALASLAAQTYSSLEVIVVDDGSTDADSRRVLDAMRARFPQFQFLSQENAGIGATRNRALALARGEYFLPMDADNIAHPAMVARYVAALRRNHRSAAATCYFLAFKEGFHPGDGDFLYSYRPVGGPHVLAALKNVYGDGNALFRIDALREVGGFEIDRDSSWEDWEVFVKLAQRGHAIDVVPDFLFYYRHRECGFSRTADEYKNQQRVLRQFIDDARVSPGESGLLWQTLAGFQRRLEVLENENQDLRKRLGARRHRWADWMHGLLKRN